MRSKLVFHVVVFVFCFFFGGGKTPKNQGTPQIVGCRFGVRFKPLKRKYPQKETHTHTNDVTFGRARATRPERIHSHLCQGQVKPSKRKRDPNWIPCNSIMFCQCSKRQMIENHGAKSWISVKLLKSADGFKESEGLEQNRNEQSMLMEVLRSKTTHRPTPLHSPWRELGV